MKKIYMLCFILLAFFSQAGGAMAQALPGSASWPLTDPGPGGTGVTVTTSGQVQGSKEQLSNLEINQYTGAGGSQRLRIIGNSWPASQTDTITGTFVEFAVAPASNNRLTVNSIAYKLSASGSSAVRARVFYSTDPSFKTATMIAGGSGAADDAVIRDVLTSVSVTDLNVAVNEGDSLYLRFYPWMHNQSAVTTGKYLTLKDVAISGVTEATAVPSQIIWASDQTFSTTGAVIGQAPAYSPAMKYYGKTDLPRTDNNETVSVAAIQTVSQDWQAEPNPVEALYFQYAVSPKTGATLTINNVSMLIGGWFSSNLRAAIYYSKDPTFADRTVLVEDRPLVGNKVEPVSTDVNVTVNSGETFYVRIYPHNTNAEGWAKLVAVGDFTISGSAVGVTFDPATVTTAAITKISTTLATSGGTISSDGGAAVTARGVVWSTSENPTIADNKTTDGEGSGAYASAITGLTPNTTYYVRAYATNTAGTAYGEQVSFTTLEAIVAPTVTTTAASNVFVKTAQTGGNVTEWGGAEVTARGIVWNTTGTPTLTDSKTENGAGTGTFISHMSELTQLTTYYVRAYATNSAGTAYGPEITFTTQQQAPDVTKVVAQDGSGDYTTVQAAFDAVPDNYTGKYTILVKPGTYYEKLLLASTKSNVTLRGENPVTTILTYDDYAGKNNLGTSGSYSVAIDADDFTAVNITFQNTVVNDGSAANQQAVALRTNGDRQAYHNCRIMGYQDTYYAWGGRTVGRVYMKDSYIEGSVDFIFGRQVVVFDNCTIRVNRNGGVVTAASTEANTKYGFVFLNANVVTAETGFDGAAISSFYLGRPWQAAPRTVFMGSTLPASLNPAGWNTWNVAPALYGEYNNNGPGAVTTNRSSISRLLTAEEAADHTIANIFAKETHPSYAFDWMPEAVSYTVTASKTELAVTNFKLGQNYPNPATTSTFIPYELTKASHVTLEVYDAMGKQIATLVQGRQPAGVYEVELRQVLKSGMYFYKLTADGQSATRRMVIVK